MKKYSVWARFLPLMVFLIPLMVAFGGGIFMVIQLLYGNKMSF